MWQLSRARRYSLLDKSTIAEPTNNVNTLFVYITSSSFFLVIECATELPST